MSNQTFEWVAQTQAGLEPILAEELKNLGAMEVKAHNRAVSFKATLFLIYRAHLEVRTALRFLIPIADDEIRTEEELYRFARQIDWSQYLLADQTIAVTANLSKSFLTHTLFAAQKVKDALCDRLRDETGRRPSVEIRNPDQRIFLHIHQNKATLLLDATGEGLSRRGYRDKGAVAPLGEILASGLLKIAGWQPGMPLLDPMCGSGSIVIEAAREAAGLPVTSVRRFTFMNWSLFDKSEWERAQNDFKQRTRTLEKGPICGRDIDSDALRLAERNAHLAGVSDDITWENASFFDAPPPTEPGIIVMNPPYDDRIPIGKDPIEFYKEIGHTLKKNYPGWKALVFSGNLDGLKWFGLKPDKKVTLFNGQTECKAQVYTLFVGKKTN